MSDYPPPDFFLPQAHSEFVVVGEVEMPLKELLSEYHCGEQCLTLIPPDEDEAETDPLDLKVMVHIDSQVGRSW